MTLELHKSHITYHRRKQYLVAVYMDNFFTCVPPSRALSEFTPSLNVDQDEAHKYLLTWWCYR